MISLETRTAIKKEIKSMCRPNVVQLSKDVGLNDFENELLMSLYEGQTSIEMCMNLHITRPTQYKYMTSVLEKIIDYKNTCK